MTQRHKDSENSSDVQYVNQTTILINHLAAKVPKTSARNTLAKGEKGGLP